MAGSEGDGSHATLRVLDANICLFNFSLTFTNTCDGGVCFTESEY